MTGSMDGASGSGRSSTLVSLYDEGHEEFRSDVRSVLARWSEEDFASWDRDGHVPREVFRELGTAGVFRRRWADGRLSGLPFALVMAEEVGPLSAGLGVALTVHAEVFIATLSHGAASDYQRAVVDGALDGEVIGCFAATDRRGGSDLPGVTLTATREGDGWRLTGHKAYTSNAGRATHMIMLGRAAEREEGRDLGLFLVPLDADGVNVAGFYPKLGSEACDAALVEVDTHVGDDAVVGAIGTGLVYANMGLQL
ncbi:MAG: acyl-CoA dehydrogenase family protein, partial [Gaiellaceae bacterium]